MGQRFQGKTDDEIPEGHVRERVLCIVLLGHTQQRHPTRSRLLSSSDESESTKSNVEDEPERETVEEKEEEEHPEEEEPQQEEEQLETSAKRKKEEKDGSGIGRAQTGKEKAQEEQKGQ